MALSFFPRRAIDASCLTPLPHVAPPNGQCWKDLTDLKRSPRLETRSGGRAWLGPVPKRQPVQRSLRRWVLWLPFCPRGVLLYVSVLKFPLGSLSLLRLAFCFSFVSNVFVIACWSGFVKTALKSSGNSDICVVVLASVDCLFLFKLRCC